MLDDNDKTAYSVSDNSES